MDNTLPHDEVRGIIHQLSEVTSYRVNSDEDLVLANGMLKEIKAIGQRLEAMEKSITGPQLAALQASRDFFRQPRAMNADGEAYLKRQIAAYLTLVENKRREQQEAANRAARAQRAELEQLSQVAEESGDIETAEEFSREAITTVAPIITTAPPKLEGTSVREVWKFEVENAALLPREFTMPDTKRIGGYVRAMRSEARIAGVRIWAEKQIAASAAK